MKGAKGLSLFFFQPEQSLSSGHYAVYIYIYIQPGRGPELEG